MILVFVKNGIVKHIILVFKLFQKEKRQLTAASRYDWYVLVLCLDYTTRAKRTVRSKNKVYLSGRKTIRVDRHSRLSAER